MSSTSVSVVGPLYDESSTDDNSVDAPSLGETSKRKSAGVAPSSKFMRYSSLRENIDFSANDDMSLKEFSCTICMSVCIDPNMLAGCQHVFCEECIRAFMASSLADAKTLQCPTCRNPFFPDDVTVARMATNLIGQLKVKCLAPECPWKGPMTDIGRHLWHSCEWLRTCLCSLIVPLGSMKEHLDEACEQRLVPCDCGHVVVAKDLMAHLSNTCERQPASCEMSEHGCMWRGIGKTSQATHMKQCCVHQLYRERNSALDMIKKVEASLAELSLRNAKNEEYLHSDLFRIPGIHGQCSRRNATVRSLMKSFNNLRGFQKIFQNTSFHILSIASNTSFRYQHEGPSSSSSICVNYDIGVACFTLANQRERFFFVPWGVADTSSIVDISPSNNGYIVRITFACQNEESRISNLLVYSYRRWLRLANGDQYPFLMEPTTRLFTSMHVGCPTKRDAKNLKEMLDKIAAIPPRSEITAAPTASQTTAQTTASITEQTTAPTTASITEQTTQQHSEQHSEQHAAQEHIEQVPPETPPSNSASGSSGNRQSILFQEIPPVSMYSVNGIWPLV